MADDLLVVKIEGADAQQAFEELMSNVQYDKLDATVTLVPPPSHKHGTEDTCPKSASGHDVRWSSAVIEPDGDDFYVDVRCKHCGRSGSLGSVKQLLENLNW